VFLYALFNRVLSPQAGDRAEIATIGPKARDFGA
jgi:hypothetical protein